MIVGIPGGRQLALSVAGSWFFASSSCKTFNSAADAGVNEGTSGGGPPGVGKSNVQIPAQSGKELSEATFAYLCTTTVLGGGGPDWPWHADPKLAQAHNTTTIAGENLMLAPFRPWRIADSEREPCDR
jgi:hypothetical protein